LSPDDEAQLRYCLPLQLPRYVSAKKTKGWRFVPFSLKYLRDGRFYEFTPAGPAPAPPTPDELEQRRLEKQRQAADEAAEQGRWLLLGEIKAALKAEGLRGDELEQRTSAEYERRRKEGAS
jgi:hypothetical protein